MIKNKKIILTSLICSSLLLTTTPLLAISCSAKVSIDSEEDSQELRKQTLMLTAAGTDKFNTFSDLLSDDNTKDVDVKKIFENYKKFYLDNKKEVSDIFRKFYKDFLSDEPVQKTYLSKNFYNLYQEFIKDNKIPQRTIERISASENKTTFPNIFKAFLNDELKTQTNTVDKNTAYLVSGKLAWQIIYFALNFNDAKFQEATKNQSKIKEISANYYSELKDLTRQFNLEKSILDGLNLTVSKQLFNALNLVLTDANFLNYLNENMSDYFLKNWQNLGSLE